MNELNKFNCGLKVLISLSFLIPAIYSCSSGLILDDLESTLRQINISTLPNQNDYPEEDGVFILDLTHNEIVATNKLVTYSFHHVIKKIFRNTSQQSTVNVYIYSDEELRGIKARTIRPDGQIIELKSDDFYTISGMSESSILFKDIKTIRFTFPAVEKDCLIEYVIEKKINEPFIYDEWIIQNDLPTLHNQYSVSMPIIMAAFIPYQYKIYPEAINFKPIVDSKNPITFTWARKNIPAFKAEEMMPPSEMFRARMRFARTSWGSWDGIANWYYSIFFNPQLIITDSLRSLAKQLTVSDSTNEEKIKSIYNYVKEYRYVAIQLGQSGLQPAPPQLVFNRKYGDCKDKAILLIALLNALKIEASPALVLTANVGLLDERFPCWDFNHMIVRARKDSNHYIWMDVTSKFSPFGTLPWEDQDISALVITNDGSGKIERTPIQEKDNFAKYFININLLENNQASIRALLSFGGEEARYYRELFDEKSETEIDNISKEILLQELVNVDIDSISISHFSELDSLLTVDLQFQIPRFIQQQSDLYYINPNIFTDISDMHWLKKEKREFPIWLPITFNIYKSTTVIIDSSIFEFYSLPENVYWQTSDFIFENSIKETSSNVIEIEETYKIGRAVIPPANYHRVQNFFQNVELNKEGFIILERK